MKKIQIVEIEDPVYEETYAAHIQKKTAQRGRDGYRKFLKLSVKKTRKKNC
jgi:hypothetical protein